MPSCIRVVCYRTRGDIQHNLEFIHLKGLSDILKEKQAVGIVLKKQQTKKTP